MRRRWWLLLVLLGLLVMGDARSAWARRCFGDLRTCFYRSARIDDFFERTLGGLDCELDFAECLREKLAGW